jgi:phosphomethylpyrimidine synthase
MLNVEHLSATMEIRDSLLSEEELVRLVNQRKVVVFKGRNKTVAIGEGCVVKVNTNLGISTVREEIGGLATLEALVNTAYAPDTMMDHTIAQVRGKQFYELMVERFKGPIGTLPHYLAYSTDKGIDPKQFIELAHAQAESGVSFMTLHPTPTRELFEIAKRERALPTTSRGGGIVIKDMYLKGASENVIAKLFPELLGILSQHGMGVSIGSVFRPANVGEALDTVHIKETERQLEFIREAQRMAVPVQMEGIGHIALAKLPRFLALVRSYGVPLMPLGPMLTDVGIGEDHITNAIGAAYVASLGAVHIINSITRDEHTGGVPTKDTILEGLRAARLAAHIVNLNHFPKIAALDKATSDARADGRTCVVSGGLFGYTVNNEQPQGCLRCRAECPLVIGTGMMV